MKNDQNDSNDFSDDDELALQSNRKSHNNQNEHPKSRKRKRKLEEDSEKATSMGEWFFDKKTRKRKYLALNGKIFSGQDAMKMARRDQFSPSHPSQILRGILIRTMGDCSPSSLAHRVSLRKLSSWGLPDQLLEDYKRLAKITGLFDWQVDCLLVSNGAVWNGGKNLIYSAPTSGGKTLVAELFMLRKIAQTMVLGDPRKVPRKTVLFVVPFLALAEEKANYFRTTWQSFNFSIKTFHSEDVGINNQLTEDVELAICTIERANILFNQLIAEQREEQLSMIVIDEIHLLPDKNRGFLLEVLLTKVKYLLGSKVQVIGMSATLPNIADLANWLDAELYTTDYRPVELVTMVCMESKLYEMKPREMQAAEEKEQKEQPTVNINDEVAISDGIYSAVDEFSYFLPSQEDTNSSVPVDLLRATATALTSLTNQHDQPSVDITPLVDEREDKKVDFHFLRDLQPPFTQQKTGSDDDGLKTLCLESIDKQHNILVFCNSKKRCENCALLLVDTLTSRGTSLPAMHTGSNSTSNNTSLTIIRNTGNKYQQSSNNNNNNTHSNASLFLSVDQQLLKQRQEVLDSLRLTSAGLCYVLQQTLVHGVAYHHAGLTQEERSILENAFRRGVIQVLCTTSTLAAGVNLPAHRVIIRSMTMGDSMLSVASFRQMCGRAGRLGHFQPTHNNNNSSSSSSTTSISSNSNSKGEAILLLGKRPSSATKQHCTHLVSGELEPLRSALVFGAGGGMEKLLLEMIAANRLTREQDVMRFVCCSFMTTQRHYTQSQVQDFVAAALYFLKKQQFLQHVSGGVLLASPLGRATTTSGLSPMDAAHILPDLLQARHKLSLLANDFQLIYLTTPLGSVTYYTDPNSTSASNNNNTATTNNSNSNNNNKATASASGSLLEPDWKLLEQVVDKAYKDFPELRTVAEEYIGIDPSLLCSFAFCAPPTYNSPRHRLYRRFYNALLLFSQLQDRPMVNLSRYLLQSSGGGVGGATGSASSGDAGSVRKISRGSLQQLQRDAATFASMVLVFCKNLNYHALAAAFEEIQRRYVYGTSQASQLQSLLQLRDTVLEMTPLRAKAFYVAGLTTVEDIISAGKDAVSDVLYKSMPYTSSKAVDINIQYNNNSNSSLTNNDNMTTTNIDKERILCEKLAEKIIYRSKEIVYRQKYANT